jgi:hypothetical protein
MSCALIAHTALKWWRHFIPAGPGARAGPDVGRDPGDRQRAGCLDLTAQQPRGAGRRSPGPTGRDLGRRASRPGRPQGSRRRAGVGRTRRRRGRIPAGVVLRHRRAVRPRRRHGAVLAVEVRRSGQRQGPVRSFGHVRRGAGNADRRGQGPRLSGESRRARQRRSRTQSGAVVCRPRTRPARAKRCGGLDDQGRRAGRSGVRIHSLGPSGQGLRRRRRRRRGGELAAPLCAAGLPTGATGDRSPLREGGRRGARSCRGPEMGPARRRRRSNADRLDASRGCVRTAREDVRTHDLTTAAVTWLQARLSPEEADRAARLAETWRTSTATKPVEGR